MKRRDYRNIAVNVKRIRGQIGQSELDQIEIVSAGGEYQNMFAFKGIDDEIPDADAGTEQSVPFRE